MPTRNGSALPTLATITLDRDAVSDWDEYPFAVPTIRTLDSLRVSHSICFFVGENGSGKSTLLEAIAHSFGLGAEGGSRNMAHTGAPADPVESLSSSLRLSWRKKPRHGYFLRAESFFNIATLIDEFAGEDARIYESYGGRSLHEQSHGESFLSLFQHRFGPGGFYLLDEPEAALSPQAQLAFLLHLHYLLQAQQATQLIIATHSPIITAYPGAQILAFDGPRIEEIAYEDTSSYRIISGFMRDPEAYLRHLFSSEGD